MNLRRLLLAPAEPVRVRREMAAAPRPAEANE